MSVNEIFLSRFFDIPIFTGADYEYPTEVSFWQRFCTEKTKTKQKKTVILSFSAFFSYYLAWRDKKLPFSTFFFSFLNGGKFLATLSQAVSLEAGLWCADEIWRGKSQEFLRKKTVYGLFPRFEHRN